MALQERQPRPCKAPSFSSSLLDAIYNSFDENGGQEVRDFTLQRRHNAAQDITSLRRAIMVENWMDSFSTKHSFLRSASSSDSSIFSDSESSASKPSQKVKAKGAGKKEPISPCGKIAHFLNSIFSSRSLSKNRGMEAWCPMRKSRSMKDTTTTASRSCLSKNPSARGSKSKRSVRFCTLDESIREGDEYSPIGSRFIKKNIDDLRLYEGESVRKYDHFQNELDEDNISCSSSDLFELENIGRVSVEAYKKELPVYGTTCVKVNQAIA